MKWNTYAGGCFAASDKNSYDAVCSIGRYSIQPISSEHDVEHHLGYRVHFLNELGKLAGGLWQELADLVDLNKARRLCKDHYEASKNLS
jgi:hypothetical protein